VIIGIAGIVVGCFWYSDPNSARYDPTDYTTYAIWAIAVTPLCVCLFVWVIVAANWWAHQVTVVFTPLPTPAQIYTQLRAEYGRPPTLDEVAAVQQMLANRRREALANAGIGLGASYVIHRSVGSSQ
jgi:hypothetical protein